MIFRNLVERIGSTLNFARIGLLITGPQAMLSATHVDATIGYNSRVFLATN
jgi:hypothetical protein